jgi:PAS domain S-box-containing protein
VNKYLQVLIVDGSEEDARLLLGELCKNGYEPYHVRVDTAEAMKIAVEEHEWDIVLSECVMPEFSGIAALEILKEKGIDVPFILVSRKIDEETAVQLMREGAHDYFEKGSLKRLVPAIERELQKAEERHQRKKAEKLLRKSEERFRLITETIDEVFWIVDSEIERMLYISPGYERVWGYPRENLYANPLSFIDAVHLDDRHQMFSTLKLQKIGQPYDHEYRIIRPDGEVRWVWDHGYPVHNGNGLLTCYVGVAQDITERKLAEKALKESEEKMRSLTEMAADAIMMIDADGVIEYWNPAAERIFGYPAEEVIGKSLDFLFVPESIHYTFLMGFARYGATGCGTELAKTLEMEAVQKDGSEIPVEVSFSVMFLKEKRHAIGIIRDISERKQAEEERKKLEQQLRQAQKMEAIGQLTGGIAHDFNNILTAIVGFGNLLKMKLQDDDPLHFNIDHILAASERAANLTKSLLAFSRKQIMTPKVMDMNDVIRNVERFLRRVISEHVELQIKIAKESLIISADSMQIEQVMMNLATNAQDAMPQGGTMAIETSSAEIDDHFINRYGYGKTGTYAMISFSDTGIGMDRSTTMRIFEPFFTTKEVGKGTGLGLSVVYGIVKQHNGFVICDSKPGSGTKFRIYLPIIGEAAEKDNSTSDMPLPRGTETILLVEDDEQSRIPSKLFLENFGYTVIEASNGEEAISLFTAHKDKISLLLTDVVMPRMNGFEAYKQIQQIKPGVNVIFISGYTSDNLQQEEIAEKGIKIFTKPALNKELLVNIRNLLDT